MRGHSFLLGLINTEQMAASLELFGTGFLRSHRFDLRINRMKISKQQEMHQELGGGCWNLLCSSTGDMAKHEGFGVMESVGDLFDKMFS